MAGRELWRGVGVVFAIVAWTSGAVAKAAPPSLIASSKTAVVQLAAGRVQGFVRDDREVRLRWPEIFNRRCS